MPVERVLPEGAVDVYETELPPGRSWRLGITSHGGPVRVQITAGDAAKGFEDLLTVRSLFGLGWTEELTWTGDGAADESTTREGAVRIRINLRQARAGSPIDSYRVFLEQVQEQTPQDQRALAAALSWTESAEWRTQSFKDSKNRVEHLTRAREALEQALLVWRELEQRSAEARGLLAMGDGFISLGEPGLGTKTLARALPLATEPQAATTRALVLDRLGVAHLQLGELTRARQSLEQAEELWQQQGPSRGELLTRVSLCLIPLRQGAWTTARQCGEKLLPDLIAAGEQTFEIILRNSLGGVYANLGEPDLALENHRRALALSEALEDESQEAKARNNLGALLRASGEPEEGVVHYQQALAIFRRQGNVYWQARTLNNLGYAYLTLGDFDRANSFFQQSLALRRQVGDRSGEAVTLHNLGRVASAQGDFARAAEAHRQALVLALAASNLRGEATGRSLLGAALQAQRDPVANEHLDRALEIRRELGDRPGIAAALLARGNARLTALDDARRPVSDEQAESLDLEEALDLYRAIRNPAGETEARYALARSEWHRGRLQKAREHLEAALELVESLRIGISSPSGRASFLAARRGSFELLIDVLMALHRADPTAGHDRRALEVSERGRARSLLDFLEQPTFGRTRGIKASLRERLVKARRRLDAKVHRQLKILGSEADEAAAGAAEADVHEALTELEAVQAEIHRADPRFAIQNAAPTLRVEEMQLLLDDETVLLEISLGEERSFLWQVTRREVKSYELPQREVLETLARNTHRELTQLDLRTRRSRRGAARELARWLLVPLAETLKEPRVVVIPDGALHYVPFGTLPLTEEGGVEVTLLERKEVVHVSSVSVLALQRQLSVVRPPPVRTAAIFADPVFDTLDPRLRSSSSPSPADVEARVEPGLQAFRDLGLTGFSRLPHTRVEASAIADLAPDGQILTLLGFDATRDRVLDTELDAYRVLHFATHGLLHPQNPELSGLMLSQFDAEGQSRDGFLYLHDLLELELRAELVVLSGCRTALGKEVGGEGLVGLARGFSYAGVPRVVASLWQVEDEATAELMVHFYRGLLTAGKPAATALREAQLDLRRTRRWQDPFFWGAFLLQGDWQ